MNNIAELFGYYLSIFQTNICYLYNIYENICSLDQGKLLCRTHDFNLQYKNNTQRSIPYIRIVKGKTKECNQVSGLIESAYQMEKHGHSSGEVEVDLEIV